MVITSEFGDTVIIIFPLGSINVEIGRRRKGWEVIRIQPLTLVEKHYTPLFIYRI